MNTTDKAIQRLVIQIENEVVLLGKVVDRLGNRSLAKPVTLTKEQLEALRVEPTQITDQVQ